MTRGAVTKTAGGVGVSGVAAAFGILYGLLTSPQFIADLYVAVTQHKDPFSVLWQLVAAIIGLVLSVVATVVAALYHRSPLDKPATFPTITAAELTAAIPLSAHADTVSATAEAEQTHAVAPVATQGSPNMSAIEGQVADAIIAAAEANQATVISMIGAAEGGVEAFLSASLSSFKPNGAILPLVWDAIKPSLVAELAKLEAANPGSVIFAYLDAEAHAFAKKIGG